jgi:hypothetical protein
MTTKEIEGLIAKYFEGETSLQEEKQLWELFRGEVPPQLTIYADLFNSLPDLGKEGHPDAGFEKKFLQSIGEVPVAVMNTGRHRMLYITSLAAVLLVLAGLFFTFRFDLLNTEPKNTITDPELAYAETQKALMLLCANLHTGMKEAGKLGEFDKGLGHVRNLGRFDQGIQEVQKLSDFYRCQQLIFNPDDKARP